MADVVFLKHKDKDSYLASENGVIVGQILCGRQGDPTYMACLIGYDECGSIRGRNHKQGIRGSQAAMDKVLELLAEEKRS